MTWLVVSALVAVGDVIIMMLLSANKFGPMPPLFPMTLSIVCFGGATVSVVYALASRKRKHAKWYLHSISAAFWAGAAIFNFVWSYTSFLTA